MNTAALLAGIIPANLSPFFPYLVTLAVLALAVVFFRPILQFLGVVIVPEDRIGLVTKKFVLFGEHKELPSGRIIAINGEAGSRRRPSPRASISGNGSGSMKSRSSRSRSSRTAASA